MEHYTTTLDNSVFSIEGNPEYDQNIKEVYSIWICTAPPLKYSNSILEYSLKENILMGNAAPMYTYYDLISVVLVMLPLGDYTEETPSLTSFLNTLLSSKLSKKEILKRLVDFYRIPISEDLKRKVSTMCNLSIAIAKEAMQKGISQGINQMALIVNALRNGESEQELRTQYGNEIIDAAKSIM